MQDPAKNIENPPAVIDTEIDDKLGPNSKWGSVDVGKALKLRLNNKLSYQLIADQLGCTKQAVQQRLKPFLALIDDPQAIQGYQDNKSVLLTAAEMTLLSQIVDEDKLKSASLNNAAYAFAQISNQGHLARQEATSINLNYHVLSTNIAEADAEIESLEKQLEGN